MTRAVVADDWRILEKLLPPGWKEAARELGAFRRARYMSDPVPLLRVLLFHAVNDGGLRENVEQARASGIAEMSPVALLKRLRTSGDWLAWIAAGLCEKFRQHVHVPRGLRLRAVDGTTVQNPAGRGAEWRLHYSLNLLSANCDWYQLTGASGGEQLRRVPVQAGDVLLVDRHFLHPAAIHDAIDRKAHVLFRLYWNDPPMLREGREVFEPLIRARKLRAGQIGDWPVRLLAGRKSFVPGRVVAIRLPHPVGERGECRVLRKSGCKGSRPDPRSLQAAHYVMVFTTLPRELLRGSGVLELYRCRWQIEPTFKRLKQLLKLGRLPHREPRAARARILAKFVVALLLETLYRNAGSFAPWGYSLQSSETPAE